MMGLAGSGSIIFEGGSSSFGFVADSHGGVASLPLGVGAALSVSGIGAALFLLSRVWRRPFLAVLAGADSVESCEFWGGAGASVWWERLHLFGVASFSLGVGAASSGARLHCCSAREQSHRFWANYHPLRPGFVLLFGLGVA